VGQLPAQKFRMMGLAWSSRLIKLISSPPKVSWPVDATTSKSLAVVPGMARNIPKTTREIRRSEAPPMYNIVLFFGWLPCLACAPVCPLPRASRLLCLLLMDLVLPWLPIVKVTAKS
jgi:hypothetical protein